MMALRAADPRSHLESTPVKTFFDPMGLRVLLWTVIASAFMVVIWSRGFVFPSEYTGNLLTGKFTLAALIAAIASFHYKEWQETVRATLDNVYDLECAARDGRLDGLSQQDQEYIELESRVDRWHELRLERLSHVLGNTLPSARLQLTDLMSGLLFLVISATADVAGLILDPAGTTWRRFSLAAFVGSFAPFLGILGNNIGSLHGNFRGWAQNFSEIAEESRIRRRDLAARRQARTRR